ncbi:26S proteasome regulatory subunit N7 [Exophiala viscosa]|uniref:COP9 signalosome complex subunit 1 n=1 Tax=Exophiala viscosa TaxID=2486360 RepID=A0AAN6II33_9EURO|nr:26S proteasome regulatory subunit N7 [Exophiala viscosa]
MATESQPPEQLNSTIMVNETPNFDLPSYISNYKGRTVFRRLHLIAACSTALQEEAARLAVVEAKKGSDVRNYHEAVALLKRASRSKDIDTLLDPVWAAQQEKKNAIETARLENELKGYKNNLIKESIRMGNEDLGTHYYTIGDLTNAVKAYSRMRDYCTTSTHIASTAFRIVAVAIEQKNWLAVQSQVHKIHNLQMKQEDQVRNQPKVQAVMGLQQMSIGEFHEAATSFLMTEPNLGDSYSEIISANDVAVYGGLCALASMDRSELQTKVLENNNFRNFLELEPHIRRAINFFCATKYSQCLNILESYRPDYLLDIYLQPLLLDIYKKIRTKSIIQYFQPFSKVTLASMEKMFGPPSDKATFLDEIESLIETGKLDARIDLEFGTLVAVEHDIRAEAQQAALDTVEGFIREARMKLIRLQVVNAGLEVKQPLKKKGWDPDQGDIYDDGGVAGSAITSGNPQAPAQSQRKGG